MGYFANGTEGMMYEDKYCSKCIHVGDCAVWDAHMLHNYDEANNKKSILHEFIPRDAKGINQKCTMFINNADQGSGEHVCSLCRKSFDEYNDLMIHMGDCK